jgi:endo-1,3(4)-beta-glucanase
MYVRDFANPSRNDPYFTYTRNKDWFTWHSWAAGLFEFADNRNQESTSESINAYYGVSLFGKVSNNKPLDDFGRLLTAMEVIATKTYWQMPTNSTTYPEQFKKNKMVGVLWSTKVEYSTFFGSNTEFIHGIQFLPFTPITEEYLDKKFMMVKKKFR